MGVRFVLPGMGATSAMYAGPWRELSNTRFVDWPHLDGKVTLQSIAEALVASHGIGPEDSIVGTLLGGIIGLEIAQQAGCSTVVLVSSAVHPNEINALLLKLAPLSMVTPLRFLQLFASCSGDLGTMFAQVDAEFIRSCCQQLALWPGGPEPTQVYRIHGRNDRVIACPPTTDLVLPGGHLVAMTQAKRCTAFLNKLQ